LTQRHHVAFGVWLAAIFAPRFHQLPSPRQHIAAVIGFLRRITDGVRKADLD
jgi:hypothetical protein